MLYLITAIIFLSVMLLTSAVLYHFLLRKSVLMDRLQSLIPEKKVKVKQQEESGTWAYKLSQIGEKVKLPPQEQVKYSKIIVAAGLRKEQVYLFFGIKILLTLVLPLLYLFFYAIPKHVGVSSQALLAVTVCSIAGYLLPSYWLFSRKRDRQLQIFHTLPDILDLVTVCVEAGVSIDAALMRTTETSQFDKNPLAEEIKISTMETRAGKPRIEALKDMAERTMVDDVKAFVTMLAQTEKFGTSLSQALRTYADELRTRRRQIAEEAAAKTTVKMVFPLVIFVFPALLVVILGPAIVQIGKIFK
jgi:tight adherence protein C